MTLAHDVNYWRTGQRDPDTQLGRAEQHILDAGGTIDARCIGMIGGIESILLSFTIEGESFRIVWPVLATMNDDDRSLRRAARIQAATFVYHDVKAKCLAAQVLGWRTAMLPYLITTNGRTVAELSNPELERCLPRLLTGSSQ